jgi:hypothetical protein
VDINAVQPGGVDTPMMRSDSRRGPGRWIYPLLARHLFITPKKAAEGVLRVAPDPELRRISGEYFEIGVQRQLGSLAIDDFAAARLWQVTEEMLERFSVESNDDVRPPFA